mmetsp:Transcript_34815/g.90271  ORF Transcript_34815/g.90271 Transcript_34815/m.90271 type:complete len:159 (-) Transcript_34815:217-693(-)
MISSEEGTSVALLSQTTGSLSVFSTLPGHLLSQGVSALNTDAQLLYFLSNSSILGVSVHANASAAPHPVRPQPAAQYGEVAYELDVTSWSDTILFIEVKAVEKRKEGNCCDSIGCPDGGRLYSCAGDLPREWPLPFGNYTLPAQSKRPTLCAEALIPC